MKQNRYIAGVSTLLVFNLAGLVWTIRDKIALQERFQEQERLLDRKESQLTNLYYEMGCGNLPNTVCETAWGNIDERPLEMHGIAPVDCAERDAVVWVNPHHPSEEPAFWTFKCVGAQSLKKKP